MALGELDEFLEVVVLWFTQTMMDQIFSRCLSPKPAPA